MTAGQRRRRLLPSFGGLARRTAAALGNGLLAAADLLFDPLAGRMRRNPRRWVFGHEDGKFEGNPRFLYLALLGRDDLQTVWITGSFRTWRTLRAEGWPVALRWSPIGIWQTLTAGAAFFAHRSSDVNGATLRGALQVNLWHGVGLKAIQLGLSRGRTAQLRAAPLSRRHLARYRAYLTDPDFVVTTSPFMQKHFASQFRIGEERCPTLGYPRLDPAIDGALAEASRRIDRPSGFRLKPKGTREAFLYLPTSRDSNRPLLASAFPDLGRVERLLAERRALLYIKLHPRTWEHVPSGYPHIRAWPAGIDVYNHLGECDALITDYSSVLYDFLAHRTEGAVVYAFDLEDYLAHDRDLLYPFEDNVAGIQVRTFADFCDRLSAGFKSTADEMAGVRELRTKFWGSSRGPASTRIHDFVAAALHRSPAVAGSAPHAMDVA